VLLSGGEPPRTYHKQHLPNYAVFDEHRWFHSGTDTMVLDVPFEAAEGSSLPSGTMRVGVTVCEDIWVDGDPAARLVAEGAQAIVNLSASPWRLGRLADRIELLRARTREHGVPFALCNLVGGQDELVFDGASLVVSATGDVIARGAQFEEDLLVVDLEVGNAAMPAAPLRGVLDSDAEAWAGLELGLADYMHKNGFERIVLGLSGGIDSAVVLALAVDATDPAQVLAVTMPSRHTTAGTLGDSHEMARVLGVEILELPIEGVRDAYADVLAEPLAGHEPDVTDENLQARIRGNRLMAISNKLGHLVLATGNKSEYSVGYATLYGDMSGGFAPIKDVPKTLVYRLARWRNEQAAAAGEPLPIPPAIIERPPTAELRDEQLDTDSLPDYDTLDAILELVIGGDQSVDDAVDAGYDRATVERVVRMVDRAEYKRRQAPPGIRITAKSFGRDRRVPITNRFDEREIARRS